MLFFILILSFLLYNWIYCKDFFIIDIKNNLFLRFFCVFFFRIFFCLSLAKKNGCLWEDFGFQLFFFIFLIVIIISLIVLLSLLNTPLLAKQKERIKMICGIFFFLKFFWGKGWFFFICNRGTVLTLKYRHTVYTYTHAQTLLHSLYINYM